MPTTTITLHVDEKIGRAFAAASPDDRRKMELLLNLRLRDITTAPHRPLRAIMDEIGAQAEARGLTPEILESLLHDD